MDVANTLFRVTFRLKNLRLADSIMKGVTHNLSAESATPFSSFPMSQQVTYRFFEGRIAIFNELYVSLAIRLHFSGRTTPCMQRPDAARHKTAMLQDAACL